MHKYQTQCGVHSAHIACDHEAPLDALQALLPKAEYALVILLFSADTQTEKLIGARQKLQAREVVGCSTAGELTSRGYDKDQILAIAFETNFFEASVLLIPDLYALETQDLIKRLVNRRQKLKARRTEFTNEFNFLLVDGSSALEDRLISALSLGMGPVPLFGGSAADNLQFDHVLLFYNDKIYRNAALVSQFVTRAGVHIFKTDHVIPNEKRMVVTKADPKQRIVSELNGAPAALEYARQLGIESSDLNTTSFAAHPLVIRLGDQHHVRAALGQTEVQDLKFFAAIDEGVILSFCEPQHLAEHLREWLEAMQRRYKPEMIFACDCVLRRMEANQKKLTDAMAPCFERHRVVGFSTYGEQFNAWHVNLTMTGAIFYLESAASD